MEFETVDEQAFAPHDKTLCDRDEPISTSQLQEMVSQDLDKIQEMFFRDVERTKCEQQAIRCLRMTLHLEVRSALRRSGPCRRRQ